MESCTIELTAYSVIASTYCDTTPSILEAAILSYLYEGFSKAYIEKKLQLNIDLAILRLNDRGILNPDLSFRYRTKEEWYELAPRTYKRGYIFYNKEKEMFFDTIVYADEIRLDDNFLLANYLGENYTKDDILDSMYVIKTFAIAYNAGNVIKGPVRAIEDLEKIKYRYEG